MSYGYNGTNGTSNGYGEQGQGRRVRRAGGYGGFFSSDPAEQSEGDVTPVYETQNRFNQPSASDFRQRGDQSRSRERPRQDRARNYGDGPGARQIEDVVQYIQDHWAIMANTDCVPVHVALQLMDHSSLGRGNDYSDFQQTSEVLQTALKAIVNEHHQGFNSSIGTFHKIQSSIQTSQSRIRTLKSSLLDAQASLTNAKPELRGLSASSQSYDEMLQTLNQIEKIQVLPEQLDARISDKHFLSAVDILQDALRLIRNSSLESIGALADLRVYLNNQETSLTDILIEELHDHLYLKSPYCQNRWRSFQPGFDKAGEPTESTIPNTGIRPLYQFLNGLSLKLPLNDDVSSSPEADSFEYMHMLIEALNKMGRLDVAVERVEQRLPVELFAVVERTNQEVDSRHPSHLRGLQKLRFDEMPGEAKGASPDQDVVNDLLWTLFSKFEAIAEGHRATHEIIASIVEREGLKKDRSLLGGFKELWKLYQSEMRSLLHDYLATDSDTLNASANRSAAANKIFGRVQRDKNKKIFKLSDVNQQSAELAMEREDLDKILQNSVPGLVSKSHRNSDRVVGHHAASYDGHSAGHKLLVEPDVFNISLLLPPSISFLQRLRDIVPADSDIAISTLTSFLDDFLVNIFSPQLDETVTELCTRTFSDLEAFQQDPQWSSRAQKPIFNGTSAFLTSVNAFCKMLDTIPEDQTFTTLIITQLATYHDKCVGWFTALVTRAESDAGTHLKAAAAWTESGELRNVVNSIWQDQNSDSSELLDKEGQMLADRNAEKRLEPSDIVSDRRSIAALCLLYNSMHWLASRLMLLRRLSSHGDSNPRHGQDQSGRWSMVSTANMQENGQQTYLPLTKDSAAIFDGIIRAYRDLATKALFTLQVNIRCSIIHSFSKTLIAPYIIDQPANEPDPSILALNADLLTFDDTLTNYLPSREYRFITDGLSLLVNDILISGSQEITGMNDNGCGRMTLNILVLQQNLKSIEPGAKLARAAVFYQMFGDGPDLLIQRVRDSRGENLEFTEDELMAVLQLQYSEGLKSPQRDVNMQATRALEEHTSQLMQYLHPTTEPVHTEEPVGEGEDGNTQTVQGDDFS